MDHGHIPLAREAEQVQRLHQHTHLSWEMEQLSEAASHILEMGEKKTTLRA